ncbi:hypothetical protein [Demequina iriomotensis]|uniref:hypothetical protein n=1 Tax=Demequina iriomotensis TaxID=1536641 RepID=UPI0007862FA9|nr:hypothetical protein [Demequina iriomotensis]
MSEPLRAALGGDRAASTATTATSAAAIARGARRRIVRTRRRRGAITAASAALLVTVAAAVVTSSPGGRGAAPDAVARVERSVPAAEPREAALTADALVASFEARTASSEVVDGRQAALLCDLTGTAQDGKGSAWGDDAACRAGSVAGPVLEARKQVAVLDGPLGTPDAVTWAVANVTGERLATTGWYLLLERGVGDADAAEPRASVLGRLVVADTAWAGEGLRGALMRPGTATVRLEPSMTLLARAELAPDQRSEGPPIHADGLRRALAEGAVATGAVVVPFEDDAAHALVLEVPLTDGQGA